MKRNLSKIALVSVVLAGSLLLCHAAENEETTAETKPTTRSLELQISWDRSSISLTRREIVNYLEQPSLLRSEFRSKIRKNIEQYDSLISFQEFPSDSPSGPIIELHGELILQPSELDNQIDPQKALRFIANALQSRLLKLFTPQDAKRNYWLSEAARRQAQTMMQLKELREKLRQSQTETDASEVQWQLQKNRALYTEIEREHQHLQIERAAKKGRLMAVQEKIAEIASQTAQQAVKEDPLLSELEKLVALREQSELVKFRSQVIAKDLIPNEEQIKAVAELAQVKIQRDRRKEELAQAQSDPELVKTLKAELTQLHVDSYVSVIRLEQTEIMLRELAAERSDLLAKLRDFERKQVDTEYLKTVELSLACKRYEKATERFDELLVDTEAMILPDVKILKSKP